MTKRMLIDSTHAEETRVVVLDGSRLEDFDVETSTKRQLKGNIYLAKVVRVEPSLQAAFVEYGGGRHGFLAFGEIHPDYYQIPVADRQRLLELQAEEARAEQEAEDADDDEPAARRPEPARPAPAQQPPRSAVELETRPAEPEPEAQASVASGDDAQGGDHAPPEPVPVAEAIADAAHPAHAAADPVAVEPPVSTEMVAVEAPDERPMSVQPVFDVPGGESSATEAPDEPDHAPAAQAPSVPATAPLPADPATDIAAPDSYEPRHAAHDPDGEPKQEPPPRAQAAAMPQDVRFGQTDFARVAYGETVVDPAQDDQPEVIDPRHQPKPARTEAEADFGDLDGPAEEEMPPPETIGGESDTFEGNGAEEARARRSSRFLRNYRIQEVIRRRQIMLIQVVKEERGTKGAALTTYISLAGRFCVLMPNSPRGGGISRKITSSADRRRLKEITAELDIPQGMGLIVRTAGAARPKPEIKRDCEYLMRLWDDIRDHTMKSMAPALIYEEASLIKRAIRDVYSRDVDEILVDGEDAWRAAHDFMRMLMPGHARKVQLWRRDLNAGQALFSKQGVEAQLDGMLSPTVQLRSGGYLVINQAEALVAIDVNSGRSTRERGIEETALRTNLEAADEVARQLRLRDLAGLIVIDFIDMEARRHNAMVERRLKDALKNDRARIQVGSISHFGLLEMSRQRLRPSLAETSFVMCPHCGGLGHVRSIESAAIHVLRDIEEEGSKARASLIMVYVANAVAMYILNNKRQRLNEIEARCFMQVHFTGDDALVPPAIRIDRVRAALPEHERAALAPPPAALPPPPPADEAADEPDLEFSEAEDSGEPAVAAASARAEVSGGAEASGPGSEESEQRRRRRRRRRGGRRDANGEATGEQSAADGETGEDADEAAEETVGESVAAAPAPAGEMRAEDADEDASGAETIAGLSDASELDENGLPKPRRRGRRGGRRRRRDEAPEGEFAAADDAPAAPPPPVPPPPRPVVPVYTGPTPADPFGGNAPFDIFDLMDQAETAALAAPRPPAPPRSSEPASLDIPPVPPHATAPPQDVDTAVEPPSETVSAAPASQAESVAPGPEPEPAADAEPPPAPAVKPIVIGQDPIPDATPRKGWWRR